jgi:hypothetical protein
LNITDNVGAWFGFSVYLKSKDFGDLCTVKNMQDTLKRLVDVLFLNKMKVLFQTLKRVVNCTKKGVK